MKWTLLLGLVFLVLLFDTYLNVQARRSDYRLSEIDGTERKLRSILQILRVQEAKLRAIGLTEDRAPALGLIEPDPAQIETVYYHADLEDPAFLPVPSYNVASARATAETHGAVEATRPRSPVPALERR